MVKLVPRDYQQQGIDFLLEHKHGAIWDVPGLGKSYQASEAASTHLPTIISCPGYLKLQWADFLREQYGNVVSVAEGTYAQRASALGVKADWFIINYEMLRQYLMPRANTLILDEAHHVRGRNAEKSIATQKLAKKTPYVFELTATPIHRTSDDLYQQLRILDPTTFSSYYRFIEQYCIVTHRGFTPIVRGTSRPKALNAMLDNYRLVRDYPDVGLQVPDVIPHTLLVEFNPQTRARYKAIVNTYRDDTTGTLYGSAVEKLHALRRLTLCKEKLDAVKSLLDDVTTADQGFLLYTHYVSTADYYARELNATLITGKTPAHSRLSMAKSSKRVVATIDSLAEGGDLTHLKTLIYVEEDYLAGPASQTLGRVKRPTLNLAPINLYYVMVRATVDETIHRCVLGRVHDAEGVMQQCLL